MCFVAAVEHWLAGSYFLRLPTSALLLLLLADEFRNHACFRDLIVWSHVPFCFCCFAFV